MLLTAQIWELQRRWAACKLDALVSMTALYLSIRVFLRSGHNVLLRISTHLACLYCCGKTAVYLLILVFQYILVLLVGVLHVSYS